MHLLCVQISPIPPPAPPLREMRTFASVTRQPLLEMESLRTGYGRGRRGVTVGQGITASLPAGSLTVLFGANGCGKSTLLRTLAGFLPPRGGRLAWAGRDIGTYGVAGLSRLVGVVLTCRPQAEALTAGDVVAMGRIPYARFLRAETQEGKGAVRRAMRLTGTEAFARRLVDSLSDGERQRVFIAKALAQQTPAILLDEPTAFLDYPSKREVFSLLRTLAHEEGKTVLVSTHDVDTALRYADTVWLLRRDGLERMTAAEAALRGVEALFPETAVARETVRQ